MGEGRTERSGDEVKLRSGRKCGFGGNRRGGKILMATFEKRNQGAAMSLSGGGGSQSVGSRRVRS